MPLSAIAYFVLRLINGLGSIFVLEETFITKKAVFDSKFSTKTNRRLDEKGKAGMRRSKANVKATMEGKSVFQELSIGAFCR